MSATPSYADGMRILFPLKKSLIAVLAGSAICCVALPGVAQEAGENGPPAAPAPERSDPGSSNGSQRAIGGDQAAAREKPAKPEQPYHLRILEDPPKSPRAMADALANLYALLATASDRKTGEEVASVIERIWLFGHGDTVFVLMQRANKALAEKNDDLALKFLDAVVDLAPDYTEGWHQRAVVLYTRNDYTRALGDLRRVLALDPNHYKALEGLSRMLEETNQKAGALAAHRQLMEVHPFWPGADERLRTLKRESEGQGI